MCLCVCDSQDLTEAAAALLLVILFRVVLDLLAHQSHSRVEALFVVDLLLRRRLEEARVLAPLLRQLTALRLLHLTLILQIAFVAHQHNWRFLLLFAYRIFSRIMIASSKVVRDVIEYTTRKAWPSRIH